VSSVSQEEILMRSGDFSVAVVVHGREMPEQADGVVVLGFGDEYVLRFRSYNGRRGVADVWIDGVKIADGGLIVPASGYVDLETPPATPGRRFRFASTESDAAYVAGKHGPDDGTQGLIRVEYRSERPRPPVSVRKAMRLPYDLHRHTDYVWDQPVHASSVYGQSMESAMPHRSFEAPSPGVTVEGSDSSQTFTEEHVDVEPSVTTILLKLKGRVQEHASYASPFPRPSPSSIRYCPDCGARVTVLSKHCLGCGRKIR
jgi:hypothetical protein